jgi:predicted porin
MGRTTMVSMTWRGGWAACLTVLAMPAPAAAPGELELYGRVNVTLQDSDEGARSQTELRSNASRIGVKGGKELTSGLKAIYQLEFGVNIDNDDDDDHITPRNQFVGLEGAFGTLKVGRHDTALKEAQGDFDLFNDLEGDISRVVNGENRLKDYIGYTTPAFAGAIRATVNYLPGEDAEDGDDAEPDRTSVALEYDKDAAFASLSHDRDVDGEGVRTLRAAGGYTFGPARVMVLYQRTDAGDVEEDGLGASLAWKFGRNTAKLQYLTADIWRVRPQADPLDNRLESMFSVGLDHALGDATRLFAFYTGGDIGGTTESVGYAAIGIEHQF